MKRIISSVVSLILTIFLFGTVCFAWITENKTATSKGIQASSFDFSCEVVLSKWDGQAYVENDTSIGTILPGDDIYFRLEIKSKMDQEAVFNASFGGVNSTLSSTLKTDDLGTKIYVDDPLANTNKLYDIIDNKVLVEGNKVLYNYNPVIKRLSLMDYKIEDAIYFYLTDENRVKDDLTKGSLNASLSDNILVSAKGTKAFYFCLSFDKEASSYYAYQSLLIEFIKINMIEGGQS